jgi:hypothetical protein
MRSPAKTLYALLLTSILLLAGCLAGSDDDAEDDLSEVIGEWQKEDDTGIELLENGSVAHFDVTDCGNDPDCAAPWEHAWSIDNDTFILHCEIICADGEVEYHYQYVVQDDVLFLKYFEKVQITDGVVETVDAGDNDCISWVDTDAIDASQSESQIRDAASMPTWCETIASGTPNIYTADDVSAAITAENNDTLMQIRWQHAEDDLNWAFVSMRLEVADNVFDCSIDGSSDCVIAQDGADAGLWEVGEFLQLSENSADICGGAGEGTCDVNIYISYRGAVVAGTSDIALS